MASDNPFEVRKIKNYLSNLKETKLSVNPKYDNVYIITDSKGRYLWREREFVSEFVSIKNVTFWFRGGRKTGEGVSFLQRQIEENALRPGKSMVLFWHFTCDMNDYKLPERWLLPKFTVPEEYLEFLRPSLQRLLNIHKQHPNIDIGVLEVPPVFWSKWNRLNNHPNWNQFIDKDMHAQIDVVNSYIRDHVNTELGYVSPKFVLDCMQFRKRKRGHSDSSRTSLTSVLFSDGVHPIKEVSQKWLYQIVKSICV